MIAEMLREMREKMEWEIKDVPSLVGFSILEMTCSEEAEVSTKRFNEYLPCTAAGVSSAVDSLVKRGLLTRRNQPGDRRSWLCKPTAQGRKDWKMAKAYLG